MLNASGLSILRVHLLLMMISFVIVSERQKMRYLYHDENRYIHKKTMEKTPSQIKSTQKKYIESLAIARCNFTIQILGAQRFSSWRLETLPCSLGQRLCPQTAEADQGSHFSHNHVAPVYQEHDTLMETANSTSQTTGTCCEIKTQAATREFHRSGIWGAWNSKIYLFIKSYAMVWGNLWGIVSLEGSTKPTTCFLSQDSRWAAALPHSFGSFYLLSYGLSNSYRNLHLTDLINVRKPVGPNFVVPFTPRNRMKSAATLSTSRR